MDKQLADYVWRCACKMLELARADGLVGPNETKMSGDWVPTYARRAAELTPKPKTVFQTFIGPVTA